MYQFIKLELPAEPAFWARLLCAQNSYAATKLVNDPGSFVLWCQNHRADKEFAEDLLAWFCEKYHKQPLATKRDKYGCYTHIEVYNDTPLTLEKLLTDAPETYIRYMFEWAVWCN